MKNFLNKINGFYIALIILLFIIITHIDIILSPLGYYFSKFDLQDLNYYINIRQYAVDSIMSGIFPFWTTRLFCGLPFFANSETAIFYLPNLIFYILPISKAVNISFLLHFFIFSFGVFLWIDNKIKDKPVSLTVALLSMFFSTFYLHSCAAHLSNIITVAWFPLLLYFYDKVFEKKTFCFIFPITFVISLQIFAGHFQYVYYSAIISLIYIIFFCRNKYVIITIFVSYLFSLFLTAIQFLPSLDFYFEGSRRLWLSEQFSFYSKLAYLLTAAFPITVFSMGRCFWEITNYIGIITVFIVLVSLFQVKNKNVFKYLLLALIIYLLSFEVFSNFTSYCIPFFSTFRSPIKLNFFVAFFLLPIIAYGLKYIFSNDTKINVWFVLMLIVCASGMLIFKNNIVDVLIKVLNKNNGFSILCFELSVMSFAALMLIFSALICLKKYMVSNMILVVLLLLEPIAIMRFCSRPVFFNNDYKHEYCLKGAFNEQERFFSKRYYNLSYNAENASGYTPDTLANYFIFIKHLRQPYNKKNVLGILRCGYVIDDVTKKVQKNEEYTLDRLNVYYDYKIETDKEKIYEILSQQNFNLFDTVILEKKPQYEIKGKGEYKLRVICFDENSIEFECETNKPAIVLYTDNYSKDWHAYNTENPKEKYEIVCADCMYKAISINEGKHKIRIEYKSKTFITGMWISIISWILLGILAIFFVYKSKKKYIMKTM